MPTTLIKPLFLSYTFALFSVWVAQRYFFEVRQMAACALTALGLSGLLTELLETNRRAIWQDKISPWIANRKLAIEFCTIFLGIFCAAVAVELAYNGGHGAVDLDSIYRNQFRELFFHNLGILITGSILAIIYRAGGLILILAWNALHWAEAIFSYVQQVSQQVSITNAALIFAAILPHLILEALAYVISGLAGVFISIAFFKYKIGSSELHRVSVACLTLLSVAFSVLLLATATEIYFGQEVFHALKGP